MITQIDLSQIPDITQPIKRKYPETAFAKREIADFLAKGYDVAEVKGIPASYNLTRLYGSLKNAGWTLCDRPRSVQVIRRGSRIFLKRR